MLLLDTIVTFILEIWKMFSLRLSEFYRLKNRIAESQKVLKPWKIYRRKSKINQRLTLSQSNKREQTLIV